MKNQARVERNMSKSEPKIDMKEEYVDSIYRARGILKDYFPQDQIGKKEHVEPAATNLTSQEFEKGLELILKASKQRREEIRMSDEANINESIFALEYLLNPPEKTGRKG